MSYEKEKNILEEGKGYNKKTIKGATVYSTGYGAFVDTGKKILAVPNGRISKDKKGKFIDVTNVEKAPVAGMPMGSDKEELDAGYLGMSWGPSKGLIESEDSKKLDYGEVEEIANSLGWEEEDIKEIEKIAGNRAYVKKLEEKDLSLEDIVNE